MTLKLRQLVGAAALCWAGAARAEWVRVESSANGTIWYMDANRLRTVGNHRQAWVKADHRRDRSVTYRDSLELFSFNCDARTSKLLSFSDYDSMGKLVRSVTPPDYGLETGYEPVVPDSVGESIMTVACGVSASAP